LCVEALILRSALSARILRVLGFKRKLDESATQALHLFFGRRPQIVCRSDRPQTVRRGNGL
jgi:hypothetical protein